MPTASQQPPAPPIVTTAVVTAVVALAGVLAVLGCDRQASPPPADTPVAAAAEPVVAPPAAPPPPEAARRAWNADAGLALVVHGESGEAFVVVPGLSDEAARDTAAGTIDGVLPNEALLLGRGGGVGQARVTPAPAVALPDGCAGWPGARVGPASGADALPAWTVGLVLPPGARVAPLALDSLEGLRAADSAATAAALTRLASALPVPRRAARAAERLRGVPFAVRSAYGFAVDSQTQGIVAVLGRTLAQEASPLEEHVLLVAERAVRTGAGGRAEASGAGWTTAFHERVAGKEAEVVRSTVLAAARVGAPAVPVLVVERSFPEGSRFALLERAGAARWQVRWTSVYRGC